jgi:hypothetical protein
MPFGDGTGPFGSGPGTGRGKGWCKTGFRFAHIGRTAIHGQNRWLLGLAAPVIIAAIRDLVNPKGLLRQIASVFLSNKTKNDGHQIRRNAEYTIADVPAAGPVRGGGSDSKGTKR